MSSWVITLSRAEGWDTDPGYSTATKAVVGNVRVGAVEEDAWALEEEPLGSSGGSGEEERENAASDPDMMGELKV